MRAASFVSARNENIYFSVTPAERRVCRRTRARAGEGRCLTSETLSLRLTPSVRPSVRPSQRGASAVTVPAIGLKPRTPAPGGLRASVRRHGSLDGRRGRACLPGWSLPPTLHTGRLLLDNRSRCNRARPTPTGRQLVIGFTWRSTGSAPEANYSNHCHWDDCSPPLPCPLHSIPGPFLSNRAPRRVREVDTLNYRKRAEIDCLSGADIARHFIEATLFKYTMG